MSDHDGRNIEASVLAERERESRERESRERESREREQREIREIKHKIEVLRRKMEEQKLRAERDALHAEVARGAGGGRSVEYNIRSVSTMTTADGAVRISQRLTYY